MSALFDEISRVTKLHAYAATGDERHLKDLPMGYNDPAHLPQPSTMPCESVTFDIFDDDLMHDLCGKSLAKPVQDLLIALSQIDMTKDSFGLDAERTVKYLYPLLKDLRAAVKDEFNDL